MPYATINKPNLHFVANLRTGYYAASGTTNVNIGFTPDLVWDKNRSAVSSHDLIDSVRGGGNQLKISSSNAEGAGSNIGSFITNGFQVVNANDHSSGNNIIDYCWKVSPTAGFSIATYTGNGSSNSFAHNLGVAPSMVIIKSRSGARNWYVYHKEVGSSASDSQYYYLNLNSNSTTTYAVSNWIAALSNTTVSVGLYADVVANGENYVAYCFADVKGFSKFGSYTGNSSADGTFVYTGFKPAFVYLKATGNLNSWWLVDNKRTIYNPQTHRLSPNLTNAESNDVTVCDFLSNGFKLRHPDDAWNATGNKYIYMAFAEQPLVGTNNVPATAR
jgi:hypothetical protein